MMEIALNKLMAKRKLY